MDDPVRDDAVSDPNGAEAPGPSAEGEDQGGELSEAETGAFRELMEIESRFKGGANWFYWIAALTMINSVLYLSGSGWGFIVGMGITQIIDSIALAFADESPSITPKVIAFVLDLVVAGVAVLFGVLAGKRMTWAFIVGMVLYAIDGLLFLIVQDFLSFGFHIFVLVCMFLGLKALFQLQSLERAVP